MEARSRYKNCKLFETKKKRNQREDRSQLLKTQSYIYGPYLESKIHIFCQHASAPEVIHNMQRRWKFKCIETNKLKAGNHILIEQREGEKEGNVKKENIELFFMTIPILSLLVTKLTRQESKTERI